MKYGKVHLYLKAVYAFSDKPFICFITMDTDLSFSLENEN
jgi:hypothetical protein